MVYAGQGSYIYWGVEGTALAGDPASDQNIPFNPMLSGPLPEPSYEVEELRTFDSLEPKIVYTTSLKPGEGSFETSFRDPFLLLTFFTHKAVGGTWGTGTGTITADFTAVDDVDTIWVQSHLEDQSGSANHRDRLLKGGLPVKYEWVGEPGKLLKEVASFKFLDFGTGTQAPSISNDFHDQSWGSGVGGWADWDDSGLGSTGKRSVKDVTIKWGGSAISGINISKFALSFEVGYNTEQVMSSLGHTVYWRTVRNFSLKVDGKLTGLAMVQEMEKTFANRSKQTLAVYYDATSGEEKYLQFTQAYVKAADFPAIPAAGESVNYSVTFAGGEDTEASFSGSFVDLPDPSSMVTT